MRWDRNYNAPEPPINDPTIIPAYGVTDEERARWNAKQDALEYDAFPTENSDKHCISGAIYEALEYYKMSTVELCQDFFWGQAQGLASYAAACSSAANTAKDARDIALTASSDAANSAEAASDSVDAAAEQVSLASAYASAALSSKNAAASSASSAALSVSQAKYEVYNSEAWAVGTRNGVPVSSDDPAYNNNAKYYAESVVVNSFTQDQIDTLKALL